MSLPPIDFERPKRIVIHGWGGTFLDAIATLRALLDFDCAWHEGAFVVSKRVGLVLRQVLQQPEPDPYTQAVQRLILSRFLAASENPGLPFVTGLEAGSRFSDDRLSDDFASFGIPVSPAARKRRAVQLQAEAMVILDPLMPVLTELEEALRGGEDGALSESVARACITESVPGRAGAELVQVLESLRDMHETGGDLDTVASAVLYACWLRGAAAAAGRTFRYGTDYRFVFVNYHESMLSLGSDGPADLLLADLPIGAFPGFIEEARVLHAQGMRILTFEDHHPFTAEQRDGLEQLVKDGILGYLGLSGPLQGEELDDAALRCGADMVYEHVVEGQAWDGPGPQELRAAAHREDFVSDRNALGRLMTELIKGGICKVELAQELLEALASGDFMARLHGKGWGKRTREWAAEVATHQEDLLDSAFLLHLRRPDTETESGGGPAQGPGSDMPATAARAPREQVRVLVALAARAAPGEARITVGSAVEFYADAFPEADYVFYCYGASLVVARRLNHADYSLNLGVLMPEIGAAGDGGHGGAAVCRPDANAHYPSRTLGRVDRSNFPAFARYLASRLDGLGYALVRVQNRSVPTGDQMRSGGRKLAWVTLVALLLGILLTVLSPRFDRDAVLESNRDFFPHLEAPDAAAADSSRPVGGDR